MKSLQTKLFIKKVFVMTLFTTTFLFSGASFADSNTASEGSAAISQGSMLIGKGASELFKASAEASIGFVVKSVDTSKEVAIVTLTSAAKVAEKSAKTSAEVTISMTSATLASLSLAVGAAIDVMQVYNEEKEKVLGYLLMDKGDVLLFVAEEAGLLTLKSKKL